MLNIQEAEKLIKKIPRGISPEENRTACSVITGVRDGKSLKELIHYYSLNAEMAERWWNRFNFSDVAPEEKKRRGGKTAKLDEYIKSNFGKTLKSNDIIEQCEITTPTLYNYINSNRHFFKKVARGTYLILDPEAERKEAKASG